MEYIFDEKDQGRVVKNLEDGQVRVSKILIHPIKSCRGLSVPEVRFTPKGLEHDRTWCIIEAESHRIITARAVPNMVLITPRIVEDSGNIGSGRLELSFPANSGCETFSVPLRPSLDILKGWKLLDDCSVHIWDDLDGYVTEALGPEPTLCSDILTKFFGKPVHLLYKGPRNRAAPPTWSFPKLSATVAFQDAYPLMMSSEESFKRTVNMVDEWYTKQVSVQDDVKHAAKSMVIERFRSNIVFSGAGVGFAEDMWKEITISPALSSRSSGIAFTMVSKCTRCMLPNVDPASGHRNMSIPNKPLMLFRRGLDPGRDTLSCFGVNATTKGNGVLRLGDVVSVSEWGNV
ncbi:MOSC N-terminal beta barrel domain-containing protein [Amylostereum chailletii]|nr:MOSC N-terminal beta barrel domain-containing protein [Amylostereum chailletii]